MTQKHRASKKTTSPTKTRIAALLSFVFLCCTGFILTVPQDKLPKSIAHRGPVEKIYQTRNAAVTAISGHGGADRRNAAIEPAAGNGVGYKTTDRDALDKLIEEGKTP